MMKKLTKSKKMDVIIIILIIILLVIALIYMNKRNDNISSTLVDEQTYRNAIRTNIIEEYVIRPKEQENQLKAEEENQIKDNYE